MGKADAEPDVLSEGVGQSHDSTVKSVVWLDENIGESAGDDGFVKWWDARARQVTKNLFFDNPITSMELSSQTQRLMTSGKIVSFPQNPPRRARRLTASRCHTPSSASVHPILQDRFITKSTSDEWVRVHRINGKVLKGHHGPVHCIEYSPGGEVYASGNEDSMLVLLFDSINLCSLTPPSWRSKHSRCCQEFTNMPGRTAISGDTLHAAFPLASPPTHAPSPMRTIATSVGDDHDTVAETQRQEQHASRARSPPPFSPLPPMHCPLPPQKEQPPRRLPRIMPPQLQPQQQLQHQQQCLATQQRATTRPHCTFMRAPSTAPSTPMLPTPPEPRQAAACKDVDRHYLFFLHNRGPPGATVTHNTMLECICTHAAFPASLTPALPTPPTSPSPRLCSAPRRQLCPPPLTARRRTPDGHSPNNITRTHGLKPYSTRDSQNFNPLGGLREDSR